MQPIEPIPSLEARANYHFPGKVSHFDSEQGTENFRVAAGQDDFQEFLSDYLMDITVQHGMELKLAAMDDKGEGGRKFHDVFVSTDGPHEVNIQGSMTEEYADVHVSYSP